MENIPTNSGVHYVRLIKFLKLHNTWYNVKDFVFDRPLYPRWVKLEPTVSQESAYIAAVWALMGVARIVGVQSLSLESEFPNCIELELEPYDSP
jgi:hypothetical protein